MEGVSGESIKVKSGEEYYVIEPGDTLSMISLRFHTDIMTLCIVSRAVSCSEAVNAEQHRSGADGSPVIPYKRFLT